MESPGELKGDTESEVTAAQDQALQTKYHETNLLQREKHSKGWIKREFGDIEEHIVSECPLLKK